MAVSNPNIDSTLTQAERAGPFQMAGAEGGEYGVQFDGPTRTALVIEDLGNAYRFIDRDPATWNVIGNAILDKDNH